MSFINVIPELCDGTIYYDSIMGIDIKCAHLLIYAHVIKKLTSLCMINICDYETPVFQKCHYLAKMVNICSIYIVNIEYGNYSQLNIRDTSYLRLDDHLIIINNKTSIKHNIGHVNVICNETKWHIFNNYQSLKTLSIKYYNYNFLNLSYSLQLFDVLIVGYTTKYNNKLPYKCKDILKTEEWQE